MDLLDELRAPIQWVGEARILLIECKKEIIALRDRNRELASKCISLEKTIEMIRLQQKKGKKGAEAAALKAKAESEDENAGAS